jgi:hypothetical protein
LKLAVPLRRVGSFLPRFATQPLRALSHTSPWQPPGIHDPLVPISLKRHV